MANGPDPSPRYPGANVLVFSVAVFALFLFSARTLADADTFWHVAAGNWMLAHGAVPDTDPFAYTMAGQPWLAHEWLAEVVFALAWRAAGWSGMVIVSGAAAALAFGIMARTLEDYVPRWPAWGLMLLALLTLATTMLARPHILALPAMTGWTVLLVRARERGEAPALPWVLLMTLWANLHGGFMGGLVLAGALAAEAVWQAGADRARVMWRWGVFLVLSVLAAAISPHFPDGLLFPLRMMALASKSGIQEWAPPDFRGFEPVELILLAALFVGLTGRVRLPWFRVLIFLGLVHAALAHARFQLQLAVVGFVVVAPFLLPAARAPASPPGTVPRGRRREFVVLAALLLGLAGARLAVPVSRADAADAPYAALAHVPEELRRQRVLNDYHLGGFLIFNGIPTFVDSRADLFGDRFLAQYTDIAAGRDGAVQAALARYGIGWTMLATGSPLAAWFDAQPDWRRLYSDGFVTIHARRVPTG